jgi:hypothetical protein
MRVLRAHRGFVTRRRLLLAVIVAALVGGAGAAITALLVDTGKDDSSSPASEVERFITAHVEGTENGRVHSAACSGILDRVAQCEVKYYFEDTRCWLTYRVLESG